MLHCLHGVQLLLTHCSFVHLSIVASSLVFRPFAEGLEVSRIIKGCWQLSGGHDGERATNRTKGQAAIDDFQPFVLAGITTFDTGRCARRFQWHGCRRHPIAGSLHWCACLSRVPSADATLVPPCAPHPFPWTTGAHTPAFERSVDYSFAVPVALTPLQACSRPICLLQPTSTAHQSS